MHALSHGLCHGRSYVRGEVFDPIFNNYGNIFTLILTLCVAVLLLDVHPGPAIARCMQSISDCSLGIYLIHWLLIEALLDYLPAVTNTNRPAPLTAILVMALSWGITWCLMKLPLTRRLLTLSRHGGKQGALPKGQ